MGKSANCSRLQIAEHLSCWPGHVITLNKGERSLIILLTLNIACEKDTITTVAMLHY